MYIYMYIYICYISRIVVCYCVVWGGRSQRRRYQDDFDAGLAGPRGLVCSFLFIPNLSPEWKAAKAAFEHVTLSRKGHDSFLGRKPLGPIASLILRWQKKNFTRVGQRKSFWHHRKMAFANKITMGVSWNRGTPKSSILKEFSIINHPLLGTPLMEPPICTCSTNLWRQWNVMDGPTKKSSPVLQSISFS